MVPRLLKTETIYRGRTFSLRVDELEFHPGRSTRLDIVEHGGAVTMLPLDHENNIWFIRQYRHSVGDVLLELPAGTLGRFGVRLGDAFIFDSEAREQRQSSA